MKYRNIWLSIVFISTVMVGKTIHAADPSAFNVTVYKTEICQDATCTTILDDSSGVAVDLLTGDGAFGSSPSVTAGSYNTFRFTVANSGTFSGSNTACSGTQTATDQSFVINGALASTEQITVAFATSGAIKPGATGWYANGSDDYPYLMTAPVVVEAGMSTDITMQFNTANTLSCDASNNISIAPPTFSIASTVATSSATFSGGDYWLGGFGLHTAFNLNAVRDYAPGSIIAGAYPETGVTILTGEAIMPKVFSGTAVYDVLINDATDGPAYRAQIRTKSVRNVRWGSKVSFTAPDASGKGTVTLVRDGGEHWHSLEVGMEDKFLLAPTVDTTTPTITIDYEIDPHNRVTLFMPSSKPVMGAFSRDYEFFYLGSLEDGFVANMAVKVATGSSTFPANSYSWNQYGMGLTRQEGIVDTIENGNEIPANAFNYADIGFLTTDGTNITAATLRSEVSIQDPTTTSPTVTNEPWDHVFNDSLTAIGLTLADGAGYMNEGGWIAVSPSGDTILSIADGQSDSVVKDTGYYTHYLSYMLVTHLVDVGTLTDSDLIGRYYMAGMSDSSSAGSVDFGGSVGEVVFNVDGSGIYGASTIKSDNRIVPEDGEFDWTIQTICLGANPSAAPSGFTRIATNTSPCVAATGGQAKAVDIVRLSDQVTGDVFAEMFISNTGDILSYYHPDNVAAAATSTHRSLGALVRLKD
ncbi:MAG: hypothetical protein OEX12_12635 [Gammaproteobacteria bacterium]|nr:hypothetical protein [Gammaproteobacteria bacterium]